VKQLLWWWRQPVAHLYLRPRLTFATWVCGPGGGTPRNKRWFQRIHWSYRP
jgi:hypothetical protein